MYVYTTANDNCLLYFSVFCFLQQYNVVLYVLAPISCCI